MKKFLFLLTLLVTLPSCAATTRIIEAVVPVLGEVQTVINDAQTIVNGLKSVATIFFLAHPMGENQIKVEKVFADVNHGINVANRALKGSEKLTQEQFDLAFVEFRASYLELTKLLQNLGVLDGTGRSGAYGAGKPMDVPLAMNYKVSGK